MKYSPSLPRQDWALVPYCPPSDDVGGTLGSFGSEQCEASAPAKLSSSTMRPQGTRTGGQYSTPSCLVNFTPFSNLSNSKIMRLIEDYGIVFHTTDTKKDLIIQYIKNIYFFSGGFDFGF
jgi:hypothetical protein